MGVFPTGEAGLVDRHGDLLVVGVQMSRSLLYRVLGGVFYVGEGVLHVVCDVSRF